MPLQIDILKPQANAELEKLVMKKLISIRPDPVDGFEDLLKIFRQRVKNSPIKLSEITKEVETVRAKRYAGKKK
jgi:hypothetical protein